MLNLKTINAIDWHKLNITDTIKRGNTFYYIFSFVLPLFVAGCLGLCHYHFMFSHHRKIRHRQLLARMIIENGWYKTETVQSDDFIKGLSFGSKEKITYFPKMWYKFKNGKISITIGITMGQYQERLQKLEPKLEAGMFCECIMKELKEGYLEYTLLHDMIGNRIAIDEVEVRQGKIKLMKNVWWEYDSMPHMLCVGGTGGGKTYFFLTLIEALLRTMADLFILDPKNSDLADLGAVMSNVYSSKEDIIACLQAFYEDMMERTETMKNMPNYKTGKNYAYVGLRPQFLIFDEYVAFIEMLDSAEQRNVLALMKKIVMLGRQVGYFIILGCQRPDAKYLGDGIRDQFNFRVALGRNSALGYSMMFGMADKEFFLKNIKGRGYLDQGTGVITEFYTPIVPQNHDFLGTIEMLVKARKNHVLDEEKEDEKKSPASGGEF